MTQYIKRFLGQTPEEIRDDLLHSKSSDLRWRRAIIGTSLFGIVSMLPVSLLQTGIVSHLPDPPVQGFDSDRVNTSDIAYAFGVPDGTVTLTSFALNLPLAALGGARRAAEKPWIPLMITAKAAVEAIAAGWYFFQMPTREKTWCGYCIGGAIASAAVLGLTLPEARTAWKALRREKHG